MNRREFIMSTSSTAIVAVLPVAAQASPEPMPAARVLKWFAVGHNDEFCDAIRAESLEDACREYAVYSGHRRGDECAECGDYECLKHMTKDQWDEPTGDVLANAYEVKAWADLEGEPKGVDWLRAGFHTLCEGKDCDTREQYWETIECWAHEGAALCECCLEIAKTNIHSKEAT